MLATTRPPAPTRCLAAAVCASVALAGCTSQPASEPVQPSEPDAAALTTAVEGFVEDSLSPGMRNLRAILVSVDGEIVVEHLVSDDAGGSTEIASVTKSIVATLVGTAVEDGLLSVDQTVAELLPAYAERVHPGLAGATLEQLLTMNAGLPGDPLHGPSAPKAHDWVGAIVRSGPSRPPGDGFAYSSLGSHLLAAILVEATGRPLLDYAREKLFDPLGIDTRPAYQSRWDGPEVSKRYLRADFAWPRDPTGLHVGPGGIRLGPHDLLKLGNLYLAEGEWDGEQVVPAAWVRRATSPVVQTGFVEFPHYGYQWWVTEAGDLPAYAALGYGGQIVEVVPDLGLVVVAVMDIDETGAFDSTTWQLMTDTVLAPLFAAEDG